MNIKLLLKILLLYFSVIISVHAKVLEANATMRTETIFLVQLLEQLHFLQKNLKDIGEEAILQNYFKTLDPEKLFFSKNQVEAFKKTYLPSFNLLWHGGSLIPGFDIFAKYCEMVQFRTQWIEKRLQSPFSFYSNETYDTERKHVEMENSTLGLDLAWEKRLLHELLNEMLSSHSPQTEEAIEIEEPTTENVLTEELVLKAEKTARKNLSERYQNFYKQCTDVEAVDIQELYCNALTQMYDPHTTFFSADSMEDFAISLSNSLVGIGAYLSEEKGSCVIKELLPGGPAERCQLLKAGDKILSVAQGDDDFVSIQGMKLRRSVKLMRGPKGTKVRLLIQPVDGEPSDRKIIELIRDEIKLEENLASAKVYFLIDQEGNSHSIAVLNLPAFYGPDNTEDPEAHTLTKDVAKLIQQLKQYPVEGLILDLRRNGGGLLTEAVNLAGLFLNECPVVQVKDHMNNSVSQSASKDSCIWEGPLLLLTSRFSASASEIVVGALQCCNRALIFGDSTTHGKGTVQAVIEMDKLTMLSSVTPRLGSAKLTFQKWYLPNGLSTQQRGVRADIAMPSIYDCLPIGESDLPNSLPWDSMEPMQTSFQKDATCYWIKPGLLQYLVQKQHLRQNTQPMYDWYQKQVYWFAKKYKQTQFSLNLKDRIASINEDRAFRKELKDLEKTFQAWRPIYKKIFLKDLQKQSADKKSDGFDIFEYEALQLMLDWLQALSLKPTPHIWCYGKITPTNSLFAQ